MRFSETQQPISLPTENFIANTNAVLCGWGVNRYLNGQMSNVLRKTTVQLLNATYCQQIFPHPVFDDFICTFQSGRGAATVSIYHLLKHKQYINKINSI
jgi:hypothetical protein